MQGLRSLPQVMFDLSLSNQSQSFYLCPQVPTELIFLYLELNNSKTAIASPSEYRIAVAISYIKISKRLSFEISVALDNSVIFNCFSLGMTSWFFSSVPAHLAVHSEVSSSTVVSHVLNPVGNWWFWFLNYFSELILNFRCSINLPTQKPQH